MDVAAPVALGPRLFVVLGTRPEAIKLAPLVHGAGRRGWSVRLCSTGQHRELLDGALAEFGLVPDIELAVMRPGQRAEDVLARALPSLAAAIAQADPDLVIVQGDTVSAFAGALAAFYRGVPVAHVEAGLRSGRADEPFPEEMHRRAIAGLATLHFAATDGAARALRAEGVPDTAIGITGNTGIDALRLSIAASDDAALRAEFGWLDPSRPLVLATVHRRENQGERMRAIVEGLRRIGASGACQLAVTVHPAPPIATALRSRLAGQPGIVLLDPVDHRSFAWLLGRASLVLTDSGGVQEEAPVFGCPVLVLRGRTERPEGLASGNARLLPIDAAAIAATVAALLRDGPARARMSEPQSPYGDGRASARILGAIARWWAVRDASAAPSGRARGRGRAPA